MDVLRLIVTLCLAVAIAAAAAAQERPTRTDIWDLRIGAGIDEVPDAFVDYACGTNGGPPSLPLASLADFRKCKPDRAGLHEVYFRYDDELEYWARAYGLEYEIRLYQGTQVFDYPAVVSMLIDGQGVLRGVRVVTDPRHSEIRERSEYWTLGNFLKQKFGKDGWECRDLPREEGERPVGSFFIKDRCAKVQDGLRFIIERRYFQKKGQSFVSRHSGAVETEAFESATRFEMLDSSLPRA